MPLQINDFQSIKLILIDFDLEITINYNYFNKINKMKGSQVFSANKWIEKGNIII